MNRLEIIANQAVEEDIIGVLEDAGYGESFSYFHPVYGRGKKGRREGSAVWPETNVMFLVFVDENHIDAILEGMKKLKIEFPQEGIKCWLGEGPQKTV
jgi:nitrogen regulatory protein PII